MVTKKTVKTIFKLRRATKQEWAENNPVLDLGEPGYEYDTESLKIGDGIKHWNDLHYINESVPQILDLVKQLSISDFSDGNDYAKIEYVDSYFENLVIDCGTSTTGV